MKYYPLLTVIPDLVLPPAGGTLSQLSDSGQTLSEDSGVDIAEVGGLIRDGSPRPSKVQQSKAEPAGAPVAPPGPLRPVRPLSYIKHVFRSFKLRAALWV